MDLVNQLISAIVISPPPTPKKVKEVKKVPCEPQDIKDFFIGNVVEQKINIKSARDKWLTRVFLDVKKTLNRYNKFDDIFTPAWWFSHSFGITELNKEYRSMVGTLWDFWSFSDRFMRVFDGMVRLGYLARVDYTNKGKSRLYIVNI